MVVGQKAGWWFSSLMRMEIQCINAALGVNVVSVALLLAQAHLGPLTFGHALRSQRSAYIPAVAWRDEHGAAAMGSGRWGEQQSSLQWNETQRDEGTQHDVQIRKATASS